MSSAGPHLPLPPRPPHDPLAMRLSGTDGWRLADALLDGLTAGGDGLALRLETVTPAEPGPLDPRGTFGGLVPPVTAAYTPDGQFYALDRKGRRILWFDACCCRFVPLPCLGDAPGDVRMPDRPLAFAADETMLAVGGTTPKGGRVAVMGRRDLTPRLVLDRDWEPNALAFDRRGGLYVADRKHGVVHRFAAGGRPSWSVPVGVVHGLAVDCAGMPWAATETGLIQLKKAPSSPERGLGDGDSPRRNVREVRGSLTRRLDEPPSPRGGEGIGPFPPLPFRLDARGRFVLGDLCRAAGGTPRGAGLFAEDGTPLAEAPAPFAPAIFTKVGRFVTTALDSRIHACRWHRLAFRAELPPGTRLTLRTRSDEIEWPIAGVADPADAGWSEPQTWVSGDPAPECLVVSPPGRFLWVEVALAGNGSATPALWTLDVEFPRVPLRRYLPAVVGENPVAADLTDRLLAIFDQGFRGIESRLDEVGYLFDPRSAPEPMLDWLASWVGLGFPQGLGAAEKRRLLRHAPRLYAERGTLEGLRQFLMLQLGLDRAACRQRTVLCGPACAPPPHPPEPPRLILEHWRLRRWLFLGRGRLGEASRLWGEAVLDRSRVGEGMRLGGTRLALERDPLRDPFHAEAHAFSVFLPAGRGATPARRRRIEALVVREAPAHTRAVVHWVEPNMRLGIQSTLGFDAVLGTPCAPPPAVGEARLGHATRLAGAGGGAGMSGRLGVDTRFDRGGAGT
ncbi:phage tail protein [Azospirillum largimobile]